MLQIRQLHAHNANLFIHRIPKGLEWIGIWWLWSPFDCSELNVQVVCVDFSFVTWCVVLQEAAIRRWSLNDAQLVLRGPKSAKKRFPTLLHQHQQPEHLLDGSIHAVYTKLWSYHQNQTKKHFSKPVMSDLGEQVQTAASVSRSSLTGVATGLLLIKSPSFLFWSSPCLHA